MQDREVAAIDHPPPSPPKKKLAMAAAVDILVEAMRLPCSSVALMAPSLLAAFVPSAVILLTGRISVYPLLLNLILALHELAEEDPATPQFFSALLSIKNDARGALQLNAPLVVLSAAASFVSTVIVAVATSSAYTGRRATVRDVLARVNAAPAVTFIYATLLSVGYTTTSVTLIAIPVMQANGSAEFVFLGAGAAMAARLVYVHLSMVWTVAVVASALEDGCFGFEALHRAGRLLKGRATQGFLIAIVLVVVDGVLTGGYNFVQSNTTGAESGGLRETALGVMYLLARMYSIMVYTVFYHECCSSVGKDAGAGDAALADID